MMVNEEAADWNLVRNDEVAGSIPVSSTKILPQFPLIIRASERPIFG